MTCIVGVESKDVVFIGADSMSSNGQTGRVAADPKVFRRGRMLFGYTDSFRMGQLLKYRLEIPDHDASLSTEAYLVGPFVDAVRDMYKAHGIMTIKESVEQAGCFLLAYRGRLYSIESDLQVSRSSSGFEAVGAGYQLALGALEALRRARVRASPRRACRYALEVAAEMSPHVRPPFHIRRLRSKK